MDNENHSFFGSGGVKKNYFGHVQKNAVFRSGGSEKSENMQNSAIFQSGGQKKMKNVQNNAFV